MAFYSEDFISQVRDANDIVDVIGSSVQLKRAGKEFKALSPFKTEKTPSFYVNPHKQIFMCFSSGQGGDVIKFVMLYENMNYPEAIRHLAERARIPLPRDSFTARGGEDQSEKEQLFQMHEDITNFYQRILHRETEGQIARDYLKRRGVSSEMAKKFRLGYAPEGWTPGFAYLRGKGYPPAQIVKAGLAIIRGAGESEGETLPAGDDTCYDRFRGRLMFPICNESGKVIGFSGRILVEDPEKRLAKYMNSPETPLFHKGRILFNIDKAKRAMINAKSVILCEGQMDCLAIVEAGFENTVAPQGTAFTAEQARILKRYVEEVILCFDMDSAGVSATISKADFLIEAPLAIRVVRLPGEIKDADELIRSQGPEAYRRVVEAAEDFFDFLLAHLLRTHDISTAAGRMAVTRQMVEKILKLPHAVVRASEIQKVAVALGVPEGSVLEEFQKLQGRSRFQQRRDEAEGGVPEAETLVISPGNRALLELVLDHPELAPGLEGSLRMEWLDPDPGSALVEKILTLCREGQWRDHRSLLDRLQDQPSAANLVAALLSPRSQGVEGEPPQNEEMQSPSAQLAEILKNLEKQSLQRQIRRLEARMKQGSGEVGLLMEMQKDVVDLQKRLADISRLAR
ncbi:MAG: DNA primase [Verrucomicrobiae bacterium]|nr:DNA primase [Verrucomicrobiae bacterium]